MGRSAVLVVALALLASACSLDDPPAADPAPTTTSAPVSVAPTGLSVDIEMTVDLAVDEATTVAYRGWWDHDRAAGALAENGEVFWHERDGEITRTGVVLPDLTEPWTRFDLATWGAIPHDDPEFLGLGGVVGMWASPSLESVVALRDLVAARGPQPGTSTVVVDGASFLDTVDEYVARRSLVDCAGEVEIGVDVVDGVVTAIDVPIDTGFIRRDVHATFGPWSGDLPTLPPEADVSRIRRHREPGDPAPTRAPAACGGPDRDAVVLDRADCPDAALVDGGYWFTVLGRFGLATPGAPARLTLSLSRIVGLDELRSRLAEHDLAVTRLGAQAPTPAGDVMSVHAIAVAATPPDQAAFEELVDATTNRPLLPGAVVAELEVDGTWGDIAALASSCDVHHVGPGNGYPERVDLLAVG